jgi:hypothetical protein
MSRIQKGLAKLMKINFDDDEIEDVSLDSYHMTWKEKI